MERRVQHRYREYRDKAHDYCCYCGIHIVLKCDRTFEHLVPVSKGGKNVKWNIKDCCPACNRWRTNKEYSEWLIEIRALLSKFKQTPHRHKPTIFRLETMISNIKYWDDFVLSHTVPGLIPMK